MNKNQFFKSKPPCHVLFISLPFFSVIPRANLFKPLPVWKAPALMVASTTATVAERAASTPTEKIAALKPTEKMVTDFVMGGAAAVVAKSAAAPVERVKLLLQNQGEMLNRGHLTRPYQGIGNCFVRVLSEEGLLSFWRGNQANVIRYLPTQVLISSSFLIFYACLILEIWYPFFFSA